MDMKYEMPIASVAHANWCIAQAERRYGGVLVVDAYGMFVIEQANGIRHADDVLRALTFYVSDEGWKAEARRG